MRKFVLVLAGCVSFTAFSQDVITIKSGESIKAKIVEVTEENISYKKYHDQQGATFILKKEKIKTIFWENGDVDVYEDILSEENTSFLQENDKLPYITKKLGTFYLDNGLVYDSDQFKQFLTDNNLSSILTKYSSGQNLLTAGWALIGAGVTASVIGIMIMIPEGFGVSPGIWLYVTGVPLAMYVGMPIAIVGAVRKNRAVKDYNMLYAGKSRSQYSQNITFKAGFTGNGLGFSLNF